MLVDPIILFGKEFHIIIEEGKNECKYEGDGCKNLLWWPLHGDIRCSMQLL